MPLVLLLLLAELRVLRLRLLLLHLLALEGLRVLVLVQRSGVMGHVRC